MVRIGEDLASDWRRLDERIEAVSAEIEELAHADATRAALNPCPLKLQPFHQGKFLTSMSQRAPPSRLSCRGGSRPSRAGFMLGVSLSAKGLMRLIGHALWYASVAALAETGPLNDYPVGDVGVAYVVAGVALVGLAMRQTRRSAAHAGETFLAPHAAVRRWDYAARHEQANQLLADVTTFFLPLLLVLWIPAQLRCGIASTKENSDDQMVSAAVDRQVRTHVGL